MAKKRKSKKTEKQTHPKEFIRIIKKQVEQLYTEQPDGTFVCTEQGLDIPGKRGAVMFECEIVEYVDMNYNIIDPPENISVVEPELKPINNN